MYTDVLCRSEDEIPIQIPEFKWLFEKHGQNDGHPELMFTGQHACVVQANVLDGQIFWVRKAQRKTWQS